MIFIITITVIISIITTTSSEPIKRKIMKAVIIITTTSAEVMKRKIMKAVIAATIRTATLGTTAKTVTTSPNVPTENRFGFVVSWLVGVLGETGPPCLL